MRPSVTGQNTVVIRPEYRGPTPPTQSKSPGDDGGGWRSERPVDTDMNVRGRPETINPSIANLTTNPVVKAKDFFLRKVRPSIMLILFVVASTDAR